VTIQTLAELLRQRASEPQRDWDFRVLYAAQDAPPGFSPEGKEQAVVLRYADLWQLAAGAAQALRRRGVRPGQPVLLLLPTSVSFLATFFACQLLGAVPVPLVPPWSQDRKRAHAERIERVASVCQAGLAITERRFLPALQGNGASRKLTWLLAQELLAEGGRDWQEPLPARSAAPAFIQFTSGSTSEPKGVVVEHGAVLANCRFITDSLALTPADVACSWLPLFHDMGLIGHVLMPMTSRVQIVLMPAEVFTLQPRVWLETVSRHRVTVSTAPNFAYDLCAKKLSDRDVAALDLSSWRVANCGGETVRAETIERFCSRFSKVGFRASTFRPVYGLAEATLAVTIPPPRDPPLRERLDRTRLEGEGRAVLAAESVASREVVAVGRTNSEHEVQVRRADGTLCLEREVGQIEVRGPSVFREYYRDPVATAATLDSGWLRTGDLGYLAGGELFVTGRAKEVVIKGGHNVYPYDVEAASEQVHGVRAGRSAAFGVPNGETGTEDLVLICETRLRDESQRAALVKSVMARVFAATGLRPDAVHLAPPGTLSKTSSGKIQRTLVRSRFQRGELSFELPPGGLRALLSSAARRLGSVAMQARMLLPGRY
jgi:fatty-acyl-CoA synthase